MTTITRFTKEQLIERLQHRISVASGFPESEKAQMDLELARIALASLEAVPVEPVWNATKYPVSRPSPGAKLIVWDEVGKFIGYGSSVDTRESGVAIQMSDGRRFDSNHDLRWQYALQPAPVVPDAISTRQAIAKMENHEPCDSVNVAYKFGWNACRAAMLHGKAEPVSNRDELPDIVGWIRSDYHSDRRMGDAPIFILGCVDPSDVWGVKYIPLTGNSPVIPDGWCHTCRPVTISDMRFVVCPECGNKRCPHANDHRNACTGSNEPGQAGSAYPAAPRKEVK